MKLEQDTEYMQKCLQLAKLAEGRTQPNPMVGSVIVDESGKVIAEGYHQKAGSPHAEINALNNAGSKAKDLTLYVNLEPCCHQGRTGPCTEQIIASGIKRVVIGMQDPNPKVAGNGIKKLREAGIEVVTGILEEECRYLNRSFIKYITTGRPWVVLKIAATLDGRIADRHGTSRWISGSEARSFVQHLRNTTDAILVGPSTVIIDNPGLTVKDTENAVHPIRITVDANLEIDPNMQIFQKIDNCRSVEEAQVVIFTSEEDANKNNKKNIYPKHVKIVGIKSTINKTEHSTRLDLEEAINWLGKKEISSLLCEGGGKLAALLINQKLVDEIHWIIAPKLLLDSRSLLATHLGTNIPLDRAVKLRKVNYQPLGEDILLTYLTSYQ